jgi:hypothetical protein
MRIGSDAQTPANPRLAFVFSWAIISFPGHLNGRLPSLARAPKQNTKRLRTVLQNLVGCGNSCKNSTAHLGVPRWCTAIMSAQCTSLPTLFNTNAARDARRQAVIDGRGARVRRSYGVAANRSLLRPGSSARCRPDLDPAGLDRATLIRELRAGRHSSSSRTNANPEGTSTVINL